MFVTCSRFFFIVVVVIVDGGVGVGDAGVLSHADTFYPHILWHCMSSNDGGGGGGNNENKIEYNDNHYVTTAHTVFTASNYLCRKVELSSAFYTQCI